MAEMAKKVMRKVKEEVVRKGLTFVGHGKCEGRKEQDVSVM